MGDLLEEFIRQNKDALEDAVPNDSVWERIDRKLDHKSVKWSHLWKVAAVVFMASTMYLLVNKSTSEANEELIVNEELAQAEDYYITLISERREAIARELSPELKNEFLEEIDQLDQMYLDLKETHEHNTANDRVIDAMISNLQLRLTILNTQLEILQTIKNTKDESDIKI